MASRIVTTEMLSEATLLVAPWLLLFVAAAGCEKPPYDLAPVHGTVSIDGKKLTQGKVMFAPVPKEGELNPGKPSFGHLEPDGSFTLSTYSSDDGAVVGEHGVTVVNQMEEASASNYPKFSRITLPRKFTVEAGKDNQIDIEITERQIAQFGS